MMAVGVARAADEVKVLTQRHIFELALIAVVVSSRVVGDRESLARQSLAQKVRRPLRGRRPLCCGSGNDDRTTFGQPVSRELLTIRVLNSRNLSHIAIHFTHAPTLDSSPR